MNEFESVDEAISFVTKCNFQSDCKKKLSGGCVNDAYALTGVDGRKFFVKTNNLNFEAFFRSEAEALREIHSTSTVRVPEVLIFGKTQTLSFLVLEWLTEYTSTIDGFENLGRQLAELHMIEQPYFGWHMDNSIGSTPQPNHRSSNWVDFYGKHRLAHQFGLASLKREAFMGGDTLLDEFGYFFSDYSPTPSLLHGDLWNGNVSFDSNGKPFVYDPASYYGDREADIAFTHKFGGFPDSFYHAYNRNFPLNPGFSQRKILYNLYHELNHFNLFGGGYEYSAQASIKQLLAMIP